MAYSPFLGRWVTEDPSEYEAGDVNLYRFVENNPVNLTDPTGLFPVIPGSIFQKKLSIKTVYKYPTPVNNKSYGNFFVAFQFDISGVGDKRGVILQHVKSSAKVDGNNIGTRTVVQRKLKGNIVKDSYDLNGGDYWEAWSVTSKGDVAPPVDMSEAWRVFRPLAQKFKIFPELANSSGNTFNKEVHDIFGFINEDTVRSTGTSVKITGDAYYVPRCTLKELEELGFTRPNSTGESNGTGAGGTLWGVNTSVLNMNGSMEALLRRIDGIQSVTHSVESRWGSDGITTLTVN